MATSFGFPCNSVSCVNVPGLSPSTGLPNLNFTHGYGALGDADYVPLLDQNNTFQYMGVVSWVKRSQSIKMGASLIRRQGSVSQSAHPRGNLNITGLHTGNDLGDLLEDYASAVTRGNTLLTPSLRAWEVGLYVQDDWRVKPNLTLNLGLRWDFYTPFTAANGDFANFDPKLGLLISPNLPGIQKSNATVGVTDDYTDFAPRVGFEYQFKPGLVFRGGYGIGYYPGNDASGALMRNAPGTFNFGCGNTTYTTVGACTGPYQAADGSGFNLDGGLPVPVVNVALATDPANYAGTTILGTAFNYRNPFLQQYSLNVENDFHGNVVTIAYVGNHGNRLVLNGTNQNQLPFPIADGGTYPYPNLPGVGIQLRSTVMRSNYNSLQVSVQRRIKDGLAGNVNYTWSHNTTNAQVIDEGQPVGNCVGPCHVDNGAGQAITYNSYYQYDYGNADIDTRNRLALTMIYDLPFGRTTTGPMGLLVKGWSANAIYYAQTGIPITVQNNNGLTSGIGLGNDRPNYVPSTQPGFHKTINQWFDTSRFKLQAKGLLGNEMRNQVYGPGAQALAFSMFKSFPIHEAINLQFRAEAFNLFNTPTFGQPGANIGAYGPDGTALPTSGGFGQISSTAAPSATPRQIQLALKLIF